MSGKLWTVYEAVEERGIPYGTLLRLIHAGELVAVKLPGRRRYLIDPTDLDALIQASKSVGKVDQKVDHLPPTSIENPQEKQGPKKMVKTGEVVIKPNWFKKFATVD